ncbi:MAG TPA: two-component regulator propeller domain-containing protein [Flavisolibacter sp.]|nr:two-component regulator propeller domain-containing protein [Flavisolibacter sp.]
MFPRFTIRLLMLVTFLMALHDAGAQSRYRYFTLGLDQGLSSSFTWSIGQDKYGFMWIGTDKGLNRYDGHSIKQYAHDPKDSFSLPGNSVYWIYKDKQDNMWFACGRAGIARYDYKKDRFEKFEPYEKIKNQNPFGMPVWRIGEDQTGRIYFACGGACLRYTTTSGKFENLTPLFNGAIDNYGVAMFIPQGKDTLWVLTDNGIFFYQLTLNQVKQVPFDKDKFGYGLAAMHDGDFVNKDELLISMGRPGFVLFNTKTWAFRPAPAPFNPAISRHTSETGGVMKDSKGRIWLANSLFGLVEYFPATGRTFSMKNEPSYPYPYPEQEGVGLNVFEDRDGNIWYGTSLQGVVWFQPAMNFSKVFSRNYADPSSLPGNNVYCFNPAGNGAVFVGTNKGLCRLDTASSRFDNYPSSINLEGRLPASQIRSMDGAGEEIFIGTDIGLSIYNRRTGAFNRFVRPEKGKIDPYALFTNQVLQLKHTSTNELVLVNDRAARFDWRTGRCEYKDNATDEDPLYQFTDIGCIAEDPIGKKLWLEAYEGELYEYDLLQKRATRHIYAADEKNGYISAIHIDGGGQLWLATPKGLVQYDPRAKTSKAISLPTVSQEVYNINTQDGDFVWITTATEVIRLSRQTGKAYAFNLNTLLPHSSIYRRSASLFADGSLWIGTTRGFCVIDTRRFRTSTEIPAPHLVDFTVFDKPRNLGQSPYDIEEIRLRHNENFFSFDFSALDFHETAAIRYAYQLEGLDKDWKYSAKNTASYTNVPPGIYTLRIRALHSSGIWKEGRPVTINIHPPFWKTSWFITLTTLLVACLAIWAFRIVQKRKRKKSFEETIDYFANSLYGENSISEICWDIARNCIAQLKLEDCVVYLLDEKRNLLVQKAAYGPKNPREHEIQDPLDIPVGKGIVGTAALTRKPVVVKDTTRDSRYIVDDNQRLSELAVPIVHEGKTIGVIDSEHPQRNFFTDDHVKALSTIAAISANKIAEAKAEAAAKDSQIQLLEIRKLLAESQLMALRAQMNPHFVFNCLNSIQECIVTEKYGEASLYLNKFSKLFRSVLNNSGRVMVTLAEEIEVLELYLSLEHMRFEKSFDYRIHVEEDLEADEILIPSMLLQPYVENALWHGLMHKDDDRKLNICFTRINEDVFRCTIDDNGIGRQKALELKQQQSKTKRHVSKGMSISQDRVDLLQKQGQHAVLEIVDKYDDAGIARGTRVVIELSTYLKAT